LKPAMVDTDILSMFFRNDRNVKAHFSKYLKKHAKINIASSLTMKSSEV